jgi:hypothetical protein
MPNKLGRIEVGQKLICNGYPGVVTEIHTGQLEGMATVRLERGSVCVDLRELYKFNVWDKISNEWYGVNYRTLPDDGAEQEAVVSEYERQLLVENAPKLLKALRDLLDMITDNRLHGPEVYAASEAIALADGKKIQ